MATVWRQGKCRIVIYPDDHNPPHFHLQTPESRAAFRIRDLKLLKGHYLPSGTAHAALEWARANTSALLEMWVELNERDEGDE